MESLRTFEIDEAGVGTRIDQFLTQQNEDFTRSHIQRLIQEGNITVNDEDVKANYKLKLGDIIDFEIPEPEELQVEPEAIALDIVYEDADLVVVNKPQGMVVHPAPGNTSGTLVNALLFHCRDLSGINGVMRPGIVHRIDKDTSGILVVAKNDLAHVSLAEQIKEKSAKRVYVALVHNNIAEPAGVIEAPIGRDPEDRKKMAVITKNSKSAVTRYRVLERYGNYTLVECTLETGRTHQIRVHMAYLGHPVVGDPKYGPRKQHFALDGQLLHAKLLGFKHPRTGEYLEFEAPIPDYMQKVLAKLEPM